MILTIIKLKTKIFKLFPVILLVVSISICKQVHAEISFEALKEKKVSSSELRTIKGSNTGCFFMQLPCLLP